MLVFGSYCPVRVKVIKVFLCFLLLTAMASSKELSSEKDSKFWSYRQIKQVDPPVQENDEWSINAIDKFVLKRTQSKGIRPNDKVELTKIIRRASCDLIGLAPTREEVETFIADKSPDAYLKLIDRLLASPHYGERWGRHWLDVARFGESHGYESDNERPSAWTYRDAVIRALNQDMPFNQFVRWQVAGDVMKSDDPLAMSLTGFLTAGSTVTNVDGVDREKATYDKMDDIVSATGAAFLGLTIGCARCHDHKYDPISQKDYYRLVGFFLPGKPGHRDISAGDSGSKVKALTWSGGNKRKNPLLKRGDVEQKDGDLGFGVLTALSAENGDVEPWIKLSEKKSGDGRAGLAHWLTDTERGAGSLLARVIVNRLWQHHFGEGIVKTSDNFGSAGEKPSHPELLEWLAGELIRTGWNLKGMHRLIMSSAVYRQGTQWDKKRHAIDPENKLLWRRHPRRMEGEIIRDSIMNSAGTLNRKMYGPSVKPWVSKDAINTGSTNKWPVNVKDGPVTWRRSIYVFMRRSMRVPFFEIFDVPDSMQSRGVREQTTVPTQALMLLNNEFVRAQANHFASRIKESVDVSDKRSVIEAAYWVTLSRAPTDEEVKLSSELLAKEGQSIENFCHVLFTLNEFSYVD
ncbi:MAG TPA: DUF1553 domain-containing protein [Verrucomicrobia bacterium]|nr:DUF1553 domain-containing protein [Verrucomicrobiales bacterium]HIL53441.1 DUF1553 domain-containing protein [Verrucomicrobiota bacterium]